MPSYLGWLIVTMPSDPPAPAGFEFQRNALVAANTNPFTAQQQLQSWNAAYWEASVSLPPMNQTTWSAWETFFMNCNGTANVFTFPPSVCTMYPNVLTTDGTTARYFRLKNPSQKWSVEIGNVFHCVFDVREAI